MHFFYFLLRIKLILMISFLQISEEKTAQSTKINSFEQKLEGKYTEWPNPQKAENHACDRQSGLNDSAPPNHILVA